MSKNKLSIDFKGFEEYAERLEKLGGDLKETADKALKESKELVNEQLHEQMKKHHRTGKTDKSINDNAKVEWSGNVGSIDVGFDIAHGGLPSIFLMYGTPRMSKDQKLYNAVYGSATKRKVKELQEKIFAEAIQRKMGG